MIRQNGEVRGRIQDGGQEQVIQCVGERQAIVEREQHSGWGGRIVEERFIHLE